MIKINNKMAEDILTKLREYRSFLNTQYNTWEEMRTGKLKRFLPAQSCDDRADSYRMAIKTLDEMFPELIPKSVTGERK